MTQHVPGSHESPVSADAADDPGTTDDSDARPEDETWPEDEARHEGDARPEDEAQPVDEAAPAEGEPAAEPSDEPSDGPSEESSSRRWPWVAVVTVVALVSVGFAMVVGLLAVRELRAETPEVGDCLPQDAVAQDVEIVDCAADRAHWRVVGHDGAWTRGEFQQATEGDVCADHADTRQALWVTTAREVDDGTAGDVVCLSPVSDSHGDM